MSFVQHLEGLVGLQDVTDHNEVVVACSSRSIMKISVFLAVVLLALNTVTSAKFQSGLQEYGEHINTKLDIKILNLNPKLFHKI